MFRRNVYPDSRESDYACDGRTVHDRATALLQHPRDLVLHGKPDAFHINVHYCVEAGFSVIDNGGMDVAFDPCVVESEIEPAIRSEEHTSELQSRFGISYAVFCLKKTQ